MDDGVKKLEEVMLLGRKYGAAFIRLDNIEINFREQQQPEAPQKELTDEEKKKMEDDMLYWSART